MSMGGRTDSKPDLMLYDLVKAVEEQSENEEFEDDELDFSQPVAELGEAVGMAVSTQQHLRDLFDYES